MTRALIAVLLAPQKFFRLCGAKWPRKQEALPEPAMKGAKEVELPGALYSLRHDFHLQILPQK